MTEHDLKYEALAQRMGIKGLVKCLHDFDLPTPTAMWELVQADIHLNNVPLVMWDRAAGVLHLQPQPTCPRCGQKIPRPAGEGYKLNREFPFSGEFARLSLAERVCVLKHVARFHYCRQVQP